MTYNNYLLKNINKIFRWLKYQIISDLIRDKKIKKIDYGCGTDELVGALKKRF